ncbi:MAG: glycoside hydrolase family 92 protein [Chitinophagaceae bacterium]|nr:MAG: glycoside hydrolase family 92 protein [Chitinophagaceae bacterium]
MKRNKSLIKRIFVGCFCFAFAAANGQQGAGNKMSNLTQYVDPYIGSSFHGHVFVGANVPFGAVQLGPVNLSQGWDWCSGYHYSDSTIIGFSHTHLSGTGIGDLGDILLMPAVGSVKPQKGNVPNYRNGYLSLFSHKNESVKPGYYSVLLDRYKIKAELTASERVGLHRYTFPATDNAQIIFDLKEGIGWDAATKTFLQKVNDTTLAGFRCSKGWANDQRIYFTAVFSKPIKSFSLFKDTILQQGTTLEDKLVRGIAFFDVKNGETILVKLGISPVGIENAAQNIRAEMPHWNFEVVVAKADADWNKELNKARITTASEARKRTFYTALYHTLIAPSIFNDSNGDYLGTDKKVYKNAAFTNLTTFSLWDTYRAAHPLFTILQPQRVNDMISSMLAVYQQQGKLPVWHLMGNETNTMPGNSGIQVVADAYLKGFRGFDTALAWEAVKATTMRDERGLKWVKKLGYIPADSMVESVAMGMEYSISDWSIAQMAKKMGKREEYAYFSKRGKNYRNYFDASTGFVRGRLSQNSWRTPFSPFVSEHRKDDFSEGNAWQYTWLAPQDVEGLIALMGGEKNFIKKLDSLFVVEGDMGKEASSDITGLIGQYAHGNEPSHHITYLYPYAGQPWKTADKVRYILDSLYTDKPDGLSGNEDVGQMSAWYIFSALGFYPANPANGLYVFGSPVIDGAELQVGDGKVFSIQVKNNSAANKYIQRMTWNGMPYSRSYILHKDIAQGGRLILEMGNKPSATWGVKPADRPYSEIK